MGLNCKSGFSLLPVSLYSFPRNVVAFRISIISCALLCYCFIIRTISVSLIFSCLRFISLLANMFSVCWWPGLLLCGIIFLVYHTVFWPLLHFTFLMFNGCGFGGIMILFLMYMVYIRFFLYSQLELYCIPDVLYASVFSVIDSDIIWFISSCVILILLSHILILVFLIVKLYCILVLLKHCVCVLLWFFPWGQVLYVVYQIILPVSVPFIFQL